MMPNLENNREGGAMRITPPIPYVSAFGNTEIQTSTLHYRNVNARISTPLSQAFLSPQQSAVPEITKRSWRTSFTDPIIRYREKYRERLKVKNMSSDIFTFMLSVPFIERFTVRRKVRTPDKYDGTTIFDGAGVFATELPADAPVRYVRHNGKPVQRQIVMRPKEAIYRLSEFKLRYAKEIEQCKDGICPGVHTENITILEENGVLGQKKPAIILVVT